MATPSVLTVPSMYGDGILYSGPTVFGNQIITNGNFSQSGTVNATSWTLGWQSFDSGISISNGNLILARATSDCRAYATDGSSSTSVVTSGKRYKLTYTVTENSNNASLFYHTGAAYVSTSGGVGTHVAYYTAGGAIFILRNNTNNSTIKIDNISLKEITQGSDFDFTRATTGTRINEEGYIENVPYNLARNSEDFSQFTKINATVTTNQTLAPDGTLTADKIVFNGTANARVEQYLGAVPDTNNTQSVFLKTESGSANVQIGLSSVDLSTVTVTSEWKRFTHSGTGVFPRIKSDSAVTIFAWGLQVVEGSEPKNYIPTTDRLNLPRLNYPVYSGCPSLLLEPQRTNNVTNSNDSFTVNKTTITYNNINSPEGIQNAFKVECTSSGTAVFARTASIAFTDPVTFSVFVKYGNAQYLQFLDSVSGNHFLNFDVEKGVIGTSGSDTVGTFVEYPNGWYRVSATFSGLASSTTFRLYISNSNSAGYGSGTATTGDFYYAYGWQVENGGYPTSYIPTSGSTVTRNEDQVQNSGVGTTDTFNSSEGVLYAEVKNLAEDGQNKCISINDGSANNRVTIVLGTATNQIRAHVLSGGGAVFDEDTFTVPTSTQFNKIAVKYKANDFSMFVDGIKVASDSSGAAPVGLGQLDLDVGNNSLRYFGNVKGIAVYKTALTDTELANLTSYNNHDLFIPYRSRMQMIGADQELQCTEHDITRFL